MTLYEVFKMPNENTNNNIKIADKEDLNSMLDSIINALDEFDYFKKTPSWRFRAYFKKIFTRAKLDRYDMLIFGNLYGEGI